MDTFGCEDIVFHHLNYVFGFSVFKHVSETKVYIGSDIEHLNYRTSNIFQLPVFSLR